MAEQRIDCVIFYVDPKSVGSLNFLGKERVRFPITNEHSCLVVFSKKFAEFGGLKADSEKRGLGSCIDINCVGSKREEMTVRISSGRYYTKWTNGRVQRVQSVVICSLYLAFLDFAIFKHSS